MESFLVSHFKLFPRDDPRKFSPTPDPNKRTLKNGPKNCTKSTDREGFEPTESASTFGGLVNRCLKPLGHLSKNFAANFVGNSN